MGLPQLLLPLIALLAAGAAVTWWVRTQYRPKLLLAAGTKALGELHWREFTDLVLRYMANLGYSPADEEHKIHQPQDIIPLRHGQDHGLLAIKHGAASMLGSAAISELSEEMNRHDLAHGHLVTAGRFEQDTSTAARNRAIDLHDGGQLWPLLEDRQRQAVEAEAGTAANKALVMGWLGAVLLALLVYAFQPSGSAAGSASSNPGPGTDSANTAVAPPEVTVEAIPTDPAVLQERRDATASSIGALPMIERAVWSTQSTLWVQLLSSEPDAKDALCPLLERYPELASSRVQLQPPVGSEQAVRFVQCRAF